MAYRRAAILSCLTLALAGCQGGGANPPPFNNGQPGPASVTQSATVSPSGGSVSATIGTSTVTVRVPAGALSGPATVSVTVYSAGASPRTLQSQKRQVQSIGAHAALVVAFSVSVSGATLLKPLQASVTTPNAPPGNIFRLAGFGTSFDDVDTVTWSAGTATSDLNIAFPRMSLAAASGGTLYAFYTEPSGEAGGPSHVVTVTPSGTLPVGMFATTTFSASETSANGFPYLDATFSYTLDNSSLGTIDPNTGAFTAGAVDGAGNVIATDTTAFRGNPHGSGPVTVSSQRPGNKDDAFTFSGTLSSTVQLVNSNPTHPQTDTASVALTSTVKNFTPSTGGAGQNDVKSTEVDTYPTLTLTTNTESAYVYALISPFAAGGPRATLLIKSSDAKDSNGVEYLTQYGNGNGLLDTLPETSGAFGPNNAALTYTETDQANFGRTRTTNPDGSYSEQGHDSFGDIQTITVNSDFSANYDARQYSGFRFTMSAPSAPPNPRIILRVFQGNTQVAAFNLPSWIPATLTQPSQETDVDNGTQPFPAACNVPAKYGSSGNQIVQTINRADTALGNLETLQTTTYTAGTAGPVCIQMTDSVQTFYDYTGQNGFVILVSGGTVPIQLTSLSETLALQSAKTSGGTITQSVSRGTSSAARGTSSITPSSFAPVAFAQARFQHAVRQKLNWMRRETFNHNFMSQGVKQL